VAKGWAAHGGSRPSLPVSDVSVLEPVERDVELLERVVEVLADERDRSSQAGIAAVRVRGLLSAKTEQLSGATALRHQPALAYLPGLFFRPIELCAQALEVFWAQLLGIAVIELPLRALAPAQRRL
jgi:hypothetical protein